MIIENNNITYGNRIESNLVRSVIIEVKTKLYDCEAICISQVYLQT